MIELWIAQAVRLSVGQSVTLIVLSVGLIGLMFVYHRKGTNDV